MGAVGVKNAWRALGVGTTGWSARLLPGAADKYFIVSCDNHASEPMDFLSSRVDARFADRLPHVKVDEDGTQWLITEGSDPQPVRIAPTRE